MPKYTMIEYAHPDSDGVQYYVTEYKTIQYTTNGLASGRRTAIRSISMSALLNPAIRYDRAGR